MGPWVAAGWLQLASCNLVRSLTPLQNSNAGLVVRDWAAAPERLGNDCCVLARLPSPTFRKCVMST